MIKDNFSVSKAYVLNKRVFMLSPVPLFVTPMTCQTPLSMGFSRQKYWSSLLCPLPGNLFDPGWDLHLLGRLHWEAGSLPLVLPGEPSTGRLPCKYLLSEIVQTFPYQQLVLRILTLLAFVVDFLRMYVPIITYLLSFVL